MSQIRFNIGVPRRGSAARSAEEGGEPRLSSLRPQGGSAARAAEERNRLEGSPARRNVSIALRAQGGRTAGDVQDATPATATVTRRAAGEVAPDLPGVTPPPAAPLSVEPTLEEHMSSVPPQSVAARLQSLAKSLLHPGGSASKRN